MAKMELIKGVMLILTVLAFGSAFEQVNLSDILNLLQWKSVVALTTEKQLCMKNTFQSITLSVVMSCYFIQSANEDNCPSAHLKKDFVIYFVSKKDTEKSMFFWEKCFLDNSLKPDTSLVLTEGENITQKFAQRMKNVKASFSFYHLQYTKVGNEILALNFDHWIVFMRHEQIAKNKLIIKQFGDIERYV